MTNNLYDKLTELIDKKWELNRVGGCIKHDKDKKTEFEKILKEYNETDELIEQIRRNCVVSPLKLAEIISKQENEEYKLKIFREIDKNDDGTTSYTGRFIACYLNSENEFFSSNKQPTIYKNLVGDEEYTNNTLSPAEFQNLLSSLTGKTKYVLSTSNELSFIPTLAPSFYLENINFINSIVYGRVDNIVSREFQETAEDYVKHYLEQINVDEFLSNIDNCEEKSV